MADGSGGNENFRRYSVVEITDAARDKINEVLDKNSGKYLRIFIQGSG